MEPPPDKMSPALALSLMSLCFVLTFAAAGGWRRPSEHPLILSPSAATSTTQPGVLFLQRPLAHSRSIRSSVTTAAQLQPPTTWHVSTTTVRGGRRLLQAPASGGVGFVVRPAGQQGQQGGGQQVPAGAQDLQPSYGDYYCDNYSAGCEYYDYGVNIEGTGSLGILSNILLDQINNLANLTPRLGARVRADSIASGTNTASRRNTTAVIQNQPSRTAGLYTTGAVTLDPNRTTAISLGTSSAVAKNIFAIGFPVNNYASSGESWAVVNASSSTPGFQAAARSLSGGLATAGNRAVATTTGTFSVGPVIGVFNAGNRAGAASQNGIFTQSVGTQSSSYLQSSSLGVVSPGNQNIQKFNQQKGSKQQGGQQQGGQDDGSYGDYSTQQQGPKGMSQPEGNNQQGAGNNQGVPYESYYDDYGSNNKGAAHMNSAGGVSKAWLQHQDLVNTPDTRAVNTQGQLNTFGAANGFGWTRGVSQNELLAAGTRNSAARLRAGAFGTGGSTLTASVAAITDLPQLSEGKVKDNNNCQKDGKQQQQLNGTNSMDGCTSDQQQQQPPQPAQLQQQQPPQPAQPVQPRFFGAMASTAARTPPPAGSSAAQQEQSAGWEQQDLEETDDLLTPALSARLSTDLLSNLRGRRRL